MKSIAKKILNFDNRDFHMHTSSFSDGLNTIDEMVTFAGRIGLKEIIITDHSDLYRKYFENRGIFGSAARWSLGSYKNMINDVKVSFGVEGDLLDESGNTCFTIQKKDSDFCILSAHGNLYKSNPETVTEATIKAIEKNYKKIKFIGHPTSNAQFGKYYDIEKLVEVANKYEIPLEINAKSLAKGKTDLLKLDIMLKKGNKFYFNSDAHNLADLQEYRRDAAKILQEKGYITQLEYQNFSNLFSFIK